MRGCAKKKRRHVRGFSSSCSAKLGTIRRAWHHRKIYFAGLACAFAFASGIHPLSCSTRFESSGFLSDRDIRMLAAIRHGIQDSVQGEVKSEMAKFVSAFTVEYLDKLLVKYTAWPGLLKRQNLRLAKRGLPKPREGEGDLFAIVQIVMPAVLSEGEQTLLKELADNSTFNPRSHFNPEATHDK